MDEVSFGPRRAARRPSRRVPAIGVAIVVAGAAAAGVGLAVTAARTGEHPAGIAAPNASQAAGLPVPAAVPLSAGCAPTQTAWPDLASLPAGMRTAARPVIIDEQFSGRCPAR